MASWYMSADEILGKLKVAPEGKQSFYPFQHGSLQLDLSKIDITSDFDWQAIRRRKVSSINFFIVLGFQIVTINF